MLTSTTHQTILNVSRSACRVTALLFLSVVLLSPVIAADATKSATRLLMQQIQDNNKAIGAAFTANDYQKAEELYRKTIGLMKQAKVDPDTIASTLDNYAQLLKKLRREKDATAVMSDAALFRRRKKIDYVNNQKSARTASISGSAWISFQGGGSNLLRGNEIVLCDAAIQRDPQLPEVGGQGGWGLQDLIRVTLPNLVSKYALDRTETDVNARYEFKNVPTGKYVLYMGEYSREHPAYWLVPVTVDGSAVQLDLKNSNMTDYFVPII